MREIRFRAWHKINKRMHNVLSLQFTQKGQIFSILLDTGKTPDVSNIELMQFTGLSDCSGKEIYEGDICTVKDGMVYSSTAHRMIEGHYQVYWNDDRWGLRHGEFEDYDNGDYYRGDEITWRECEVIGNIYDHPELLEAIA